ncbi:hypothetical protein BPAE_0176g00110 [Botrytis paeoniae]|uniref:Uncharacterized protein n=1 Tax=Botrytis paeoniae TaxID=278948 RepID=A0A4Z1FCK6_9HELO|nr:hypothetical protein BPAE_0176g00110 [Botrytis paeoniae]
MPPKRNTKLNHSTHSIYQTTPTTPASQPASYVGKQPKQAYIRERKCGKRSEKRVGFSLCALRGLAPFYAREKGE